MTPTRTQFSPEPRSARHTPLSVVIILALLAIIALFPTEAGSATATEKDPRRTELDGFWAEVARAVQAGDFEAYRGTCHADGVLVSGVSRKCVPLSKALAGWKQGFVDTKSGKIKAGVQFRFSQRLSDETTAHESGIFRYFTVKADGEIKEDYIHFEALLVKRGTWQTLMEYQKSQASKMEWDALK